MKKILLNLSLLYCMICFLAVKATSKIDTDTLHYIKNTFEKTAFRDFNKTILLTLLYELENLLPEKANELRILVYSIIKTYTPYAYSDDYNAKVERVLFILDNFIEKIEKEEKIEENINTAKDLLYALYIQSGYESTQGKEKNVKEVVNIFLQDEVQMALDLVLSAREESDSNYIFSVAKTIKENARKGEYQKAIADIAKLLKKILYLS